MKSHTHTQIYLNLYGYMHIYINVYLYVWDGVLDAPFKPLSTKTKTFVIIVMHK